MKVILWKHPHLSSDLLQTTHKRIIVDHLKHIYCYLTLTYPTNEVHAILTHLAQDAQLNVHQLMSVGMDLDIWLIMHLGQNKQQARFLFRQILFVCSGINF